jgi:hypothetical protein
VAKLLNQILLTSCCKEIDREKIILKLEEIKNYLKKLSDYLNYAEEEELEELEELFESDEIEEFPFLSNEEHRYSQNMSHSLCISKHFPLFFIKIHQN